MVLLMKGNTDLLKCFHIFELNYKTLITILLEGTNWCTYDRELVKNHYFLWWYSILKGISVKHTSSFVDQILVLRGVRLQIEQAPQDF